MTATTPLTSAHPLPEDALTPELAMRPLALADFTGQPHLKDNLKVFIEAARKRNEVLDHTLFYGPPGLGKTTLAQIVAKELGVDFRATSGPMLTKAGDLAAIITNLNARDVLFIDEIHRLSPQVEEVLYSAMEDFQLDLIIGEGPAARSIRIDVQPFTLVGATTRSGLLTNPLRDRFGIPLRLNFYSPEELQSIVTRGAAKLGTPIEKAAALEVAQRSRGTPRIAGRLLRRVRDFANVANADMITLPHVQEALTRLQVDTQGLDEMDRKYLTCLSENYGGGPAGIETLAAALSEQRDTLEEVVEPYLMQLGFVQRTPRGRMLTHKAYQHLGLPVPEEAQGSLL